MPDEMTITPSRENEAPTFGFAPDEILPFEGSSYELIRLNPPNALDQKGRPIGKAPGKGWRTVEPLTVAEARDLLAGDINVGVRLRPTDLVVDVDPRAFEEGDDPIARLQADLGIDLEQWPKVETGSNGSHYYMTVEAGTRVRDTVEEYPGIEFKAFGRQMVAPGSSHPETRTAYRWDPLAEPVTATKPAPAALIDLIRRPEVIGSEGAGDFDAEAIELMLTGLDAADYRDQTKWLEMMMACHHASAGEARQEFIAWSTLDPEYADDAHLIGRRWDSLHGDDNGSRITVKTLFKALHDRDRGDLIAEAERGDPVDDFPVDDLDDLPAFLTEQPEQSLLERVNSDRFTVLTGGSYLVGRERTDPRTGLFNVEWYAPGAVKQHMNVRSVETPEGKQVPLGTWWANHPQRRQYDGVIFDPTPGACHEGLYNLWRGWAMDPYAGDWSPMKDLICNVLCRGDEASYEYVVKWMAHMFQHPSRPAEVALVFKGTKGTGKGTLGRALKDIAGKHGRHVTNSNHFTGRFNEHLADTILLFVDEGFWAGDKGAEGQLKGLITEKTLTFEGKGKPIVQGPNQLHVVMASNEDWVVPATADERRFAVFEVDEVQAKQFPYFGLLIEEGEQRDRLLAAMLHDLMNMDLGDWHPRRDIPQTKALLDQKLEGLTKNPIDAWWFACLESGSIDYLIGTDGWPDGFDVDPEGKDGMVDALNMAAKGAGSRVRYTKTKLARYLGACGVGVGDRVRNAQNQKVWAVPPLDEARSAFEKKWGGSIDWPD